MRHMTTLGVVRKRFFLSGDPFEPQIWLDFEGGRAFFEGNTNAAGFNAYNYDVSFGAQQRIDSDWVVGAAAGYEYDHLKFDLAGHGRAHTAQGALYASYNQPEYYAFSDLVGGWSDFKIVRPIQYSTNDLTATGCSMLYHTTLYTEVGLNLDACYFMIQPFAAVDVSYYRFDGVQETGTGVVDLDIRGKSIVDTNTYLGAHFLTRLPQDFIWSCDLAWGIASSIAIICLTLIFKDLGQCFRSWGLTRVRTALRVVSMWQEHSLIHLLLTPSFLAKFGVTSQVMKGQ